MIDGTPQIHLPAGDTHHHLVEVLAIARPWTAPTYPSRDHRSEFQHPTPKGFVRNVEPPFGQQFLDVAIAQREAQIEPDRMVDDHRGKTVAAIGDFSHRAGLPLPLASELSGYPDNAQPRRRPGLLRNSGREFGRPLGGQGVH